MKEDFIKAIKNKQKIRITFYSQEDMGNIIRVCAPMDFGPSRKSLDNTDKYHMWDYESDQGPHTLSLPQEQVKNIEVLSENFDPTEFVKWEPNWFISRDWGDLS